MPDILYIDEEKKYVRVEPMVTIGEVTISTNPKSKYSQDLNNGLARYLDHGHVSDCWMDTNDELNSGKNVCYLDVRYSESDCALWGAQIPNTFKILTIQNGGKN